MTELRVRDWPRSVAWYRDALGLPVEMLDEVRKFALLGGEGGRIALKGGATIPVTSCLGLSFLVEDIGATKRRLVEGGCDCTEIVCDASEGFSSFRTIDPDLVPIQVFAWDSPPPRC